MVSKEDREVILSSDLLFVTEYEDFFYFKIDPHSTEMWKINKSTGELDYEEGIEYAFEPYKETNKTLDELARSLNDSEIKEFKQFLYSFS